LFEIIEAFTRLDLDVTRALTKQAVQAGIPARTILEKGLSKGLDQVGELFANQQYFLAELMVAAYIMEQVMPEISEKLKEEVGEDTLQGKIVFGTVEKMYPLTCSYKKSVTFNPISLRYPHSS
jgi:methanogenic corrinoid protein MtbC1